MKKLVATILAMSMALSLAACSSGSSSTSSSSSSTSSSSETTVTAAAPTTTATAEDPVTITVWMGSWWEDTAPAIKEKFESEHDNIIVNIETQPVNGYTDNIVTATLAGSPPDVVDLDVTSLPSMISQGMLLDISATAATVDRDLYAPAAWDAGVSDGKTYALPNRSTTSAYFYNKTMFDAAGLDYPTDDWTWYDLLDMAQELTIPGEQYGLGIAVAASDPSNVFTSFSPVLWAFGGEYLSDDGTTCTLDTPEAIEAITFWTELYTEYEVVPEGSLNYALTKDVQPMFLANQVAMMPGESAAYETFMADEDLEWGTVIVPGGQSGGGAWAMGVPVTAEYPDEAQIFITWFIEEENQEELMIRQPAHLDALDVEPWNTEEYDVFIRATEINEHMNPRVPEWNDMRTVMIEEFQKIMMGDITPEEGALNMTADINKLLAG